MNRLVCVFVIFMILGLTSPTLGQSDLPEPFESSTQSLLQFVERSDDDIIILGLRLNQFTLSDGLLAYQDGEDIWVPLGAIVSALEFPIKVDPAKGQAMGWFLREDRVFLLDITTGELLSGDKRARLGPTDIERHRDDIYVRLDALQGWFPVHFTLDLQSLVIAVTSLELLPIEERVERENRRKGLRVDGVHLDEYKEQIGKDPSFSWPFVDTSTAVSINNRPRSENANLQYSSTAAGIFAGFDTQLSIFASNESATPNLRIRATRYRAGGSILGLKPVKRFTMGDVISDNDPLITENTVGRGFEISSFRFNQIGDPKRITLRGELAVGWEVELYQNGTLIDYITESEDGRFEFADIASIAGLNVFRLVYYGPQGQKREEYQRFYANTGVLDQGESNFHITLNQKNRDLIESKTLNIGRNPDSGAWRFVASGEYGLLETMTASMSLASVSVDGKRTSYIRTGVRGSFLGTFSGADFAVSEDGGVALGVRTQTRLAGISLTAEHNQFSGFRSEVTDDDLFGGHLSSESLIRVAGVTPGLGRMKFPFTFSARHRGSDVGEYDLEFFGRLSSRIANITVSADTLWNHHSNRDVAWNTALRVSTLFGDLRLRGEANFEHRPRSLLSNLLVNADWSLTRQLGTRFSIRHNRRSDQPVTSFGAGLNAELRAVTMGLQFEIDNDGNYSALFGLSFGWGKYPRSGDFFTKGQPFAMQGLASPFVFVDRNGNGSFDRDTDEPLPDVEFSANGLRFDQTTDENGKTLLTGFPIYQPADIALAEGSLKNPYLKPASKGTRFIPRPGFATRVDFPVLETGEVDGAVYAIRGGKQAAISGIQILLMNEDGVEQAKTLSAFDGFYLFDQMPYGVYFIQPDQQQVEALGYQPFEPIEVVLDLEEPVAFGFDVVLVPNSAQLEAEMAVALETKDKATEDPSTERSTNEGRFAVHLFSFRYLTSAHDAWSSLTHRYGDVIEELEVRITDYRSDSGKHYYRMNFGSFATEDEAKNLCELIDRDEHYCLVTEYGGKRWVPLKEYN